MREIFTAAFWRYLWHPHDQPAPVPQDIGDGVNTWPCINEDVEHGGPWCTCTPRQPLACEATAATADMTFGPCIKATAHKGRHEDADGSSWTERCQGCGHTEDEGCGCPPADTVRVPRSAARPVTYDPDACEDETCSSCAWGNPCGRDDTVSVPRDALKGLVEVATWVSRVLSYAAFSARCPDAKARRALRALDDAGLLDQFREEET